MWGETAPETTLASGHHRARRPPSGRGAWTSPQSRARLPRRYHQASGRGGGCKGIDVRYQRGSTWHYIPPGGGDSGDDDNGNENTKQSPLPVILSIWVQPKLFCPPHLREDQDVNGAVCACPISARQRHLPLPPPFYSNVLLLLLLPIALFLLDGRLDRDIHKPVHKTIILLYYSCSTYLLLEEESHFICSIWYYYCSIKLIQGDYS